MSARPNYVIVLVGAPRTGKTFYLDNLIAKEKKKVLIYDVNNEKNWRKYPQMALHQVPLWKSGKYRLFTDDTEQLFTHIYQSVRNASIVLEDATSYINNNTAAILKKILVSRRHWNLDVYLTFHGLNMVPPLVYELCNFIVVKKTNDNVRKLKRIDKIPNPDELLTAWEYVKNSKNQYEQKTVKIHA